MIDYKLLSEAQDFYETKGYQKIEVPWMVTEAVDSITRPSFVKPLIVPEKNKNLIASGEQGFLYLMLKGYLAPGKYQTITPCFRDDEYDFAHSKTFVKLELINTLNRETDLDEILTDAQDFFESKFGNEKIDRCFEDNVFDINYDNVELGSYGMRKHKHLKWTFGTGLAEPRTSRILKTI